MSSGPQDRLRAEDLRLGYGERTVVDRLDITIPDGKVTTIVGPNGCGKSTVLRALVRSLKPRSGTVLLDGHDIAHLPSRLVARTLGLLPQSAVAPDGLLVRDLVARGRYPHQSWYRQQTPEDHAAVGEALRLTGTESFAERPVDTLSGGQRQRVWIALTLAQQTDLILLDEPTTYLDLAHAIDVLDLVAELRDERGKTVVMVLHDLNLAARYSDWMIAMSAGEIVAAGTPGTVLTAELLRQSFGLAAEVVEDPVAGGPLIVPKTRRTDAPARLP
ncbi:cobalamin/Fe(3+)-siderophore ABC transporter ATP-binding protein [Amycolatopsis sp. A1MSW2902]|uniref:ABC transporter ATP-binding protein n=1 Tax=Amycolatopsis sp. A1MSW2902 TaxID=687413 RepID=UPI00307E9D97